MLRKSFALSLVGALWLAFSGVASAQSPFRVSASQKGSLLIYSKIEIKWDRDGNVIQDTFLDITNDFPGDVRIQGYFINGDTELEEICSGEPCTNIIQKFEPGWNTANCGFTLTADQPSFWSAAQGFAGAPANGGFRCQSFSVLDIDGPGRPDPESGMEDNILRGYAVFWAELFIPNTATQEQPTTPGFPNGVFVPIKWNHLKGDALIVNYRNGTAWEYNAWAFASHRSVKTGAQIGHPGELFLDGKMYDWPFSSLLFDFYGAGSTALSGGGTTVEVNTDLTVHAVSVDLRQDGCGPVLTKIEASIWNEFETKFSGTRRCICCWDQTMLSDWVRSAAVPNHFKRSALRTDKGKARLNGVESTECDYFELCGETAFAHRSSFGCNGNVAGRLFESEDAAILGLATKFLGFSSSTAAHITARATAGMNLVGMGQEAAYILYDPSEGSPSLLAPDGRTPSRTIGGKASGFSGDRSSVGR
ncbi:MAG: hypothetical protein IID33_15785 [Planctomycetes bacterium]|nr:hypothetical protein [Planctomycetota bacterium]